MLTAALPKTRDGRRSCALNKTEYNNTIRDLVGVNFSPAEDFPSDDVGYGFDNIGDVLTLSPILFEKYLDAAERILDQAIVVAKPIAVTKETFRPQDFISSFGKTPAAPRQRFGLYTNGKVHVRYHFMFTGEYIIRARRLAKRAGNELPKMVFQLDNKPIKTVDVEALEKKPKVYEIKTTVPVGSHNVELAFTNDYSDPTSMDLKNKDRNLFVESLEIEGPFNVRPVELTASHKKIMIAKPANKSDQEAAARKIIENFATKAYRRPVQKNEIDRVLKFFATCLVKASHSNRHSIVVAADLGFAQFPVSD